MERLTPDQFKLFQNALCEAFPDQQDLAQMVRFALDENLNLIAHGANLKGLVFELILWAEAQGKLRELIDGAIETIPDNPALKAFVHSLPEPPPTTDLETLESIQTPEPEALVLSLPSVTIPPTPFVYGPPAHPAQFVGRRGDLRRIIGRIVNNGESTAIIGEPHIGKTSLLHYLHDAESGAVLFGQHLAQLCFSYIDSHALAGVTQMNEFWERAFAPLNDVPQIHPHLQACHAATYSERSIEKLMQQLATQKRRLVLLIDEFDALLHHPVLNSAAFFGGLRAMASLSRGALAVVLASRLPLTQLNAQTQAINPSGSPFFNIYAEITLAALNDKETNHLLDRAAEKFDDSDRRLLRQLSGGHPFLLQAVAAALWDQYADGVEDAPERRTAAVDRVHKELRYHFADTWQNWSPEFRQAYTSIALVQLKGELGQRDLHVDDFMAELPNWGPELKELAYVGFVKKSKMQPSGWRITQTITLAWLMDELTKAMRSEDELGKWLAESEIEGRWTQGQRERLLGAGKGMVNFTQELLVSLAQGFGEGLSPGP